MAELKIQELSRTALAALMGAAVALVFGVLHLAGGLSRVENLAYDLRFRLLARPDLVSKEVAIIDIDNASLANEDMRENFGRWPWRRRLYAQLLWYLRQAPARAVGIDLMFGGRDEHPGDDEAFARLLGEKRDTMLAFILNRVEVTGTGREVSPAQARLRQNTWTVGNPQCGPGFEYPGVEISLEELNAQARGLGGITAEPDSDGVLRRAPLLLRYTGAYYPSLALALAAPSVDSSDGRKANFNCRGSLRIGTREIPVEAKSGQPLLFWYGPEFTFSYYPVWEIFNSALDMANGQKPKIPPSVFKDRIVLIGTSATALADFRPTPFSAHMPGVEAHATLISNLLRGHFVQAAGNAWALVAILALSLGTSLAVWRFADWRLYTAVALALTAGFLVLNFLLFSRERISLALVAPVAALAFTYGAGNLTRYVTEGREKKRYRSTLLKYVAPQLVEAIMKDGRLAQLHNEKRELTVLFSDVRGFTSISEKIPVNELVATLNEFLNAMVEVIFRHGGTLDKFVGDCVMAFWGAPVAQENHAELAARAALEMQAALERLNERWQKENRPELKIGVGLNSGEMIFGNIGSERRMDFTVIGDNVNLASRLESSTKELKASIVISDATYQHISAMAEVRDLGTIHVKGKDVPIKVYELLGMNKKGGESRDAISA